MIARSRPLALILLLAAVALSSTGCEAFSSPQNTFAPAGEVAESQRWDFLFVMWPALVIMIGVLAACVALPIMFRRKKGDPGLPKQVHGNTPLELGWTIAPAILLAVVAVPTIAGIQDLGRKPKPESLEVVVTGQRFSWLFEYPEIQVEGQPLQGEVGELRIPVGREVGLRIESIDVNHSFWVPKLAGKTDAIQNHPNVMWIKADRAGTYEGQCAEFCGLQHSDMRLRVIAMPEEEFNAWVADQGGTEQRDDEGNPGEEEGDEDEEETGGGAEPEDQ
jgi:cytochrome c oxidase subunit 2